MATTKQKTQEKGRSPIIFYSYEEKTAHFPRKEGCYLRYFVFDTLIFLACHCDLDAEITENIWILCDTLSNATPNVSLFSLVFWKCSQLKHRKSSLKQKNSKRMSVESTNAERPWHQRKTCDGFQTWRIESWWILELEAVQQACQD